MYSWQQWFVQVTLPVIITIAIGTWSQCKHTDRLKKAIDKSIDRIEQRSASIVNL
jgi:hypothetical protein